MSTDEPAAPRVAPANEPQPAGAQIAAAGSNRVFIGYKKADRERVKPIATALQREGFEVWWDTKILHGQDWRQIISQQVTQAGVVVVLWSKLSVKSRWVLDEASEGERRGVLVPALLDDVEPPFGFRGIQAARLFLNDEDENKTFLESIHDVLKKARPDQAEAAFAGASVSG